MIDSMLYKNVITNIVDECIELLRDTEYRDESNDFRKQYCDINNQEKINIVFAGEYSTGKSSIIKALTEDDDIEIQEKPTTCTEIKYDYNGLCITDTPGLNSGNEEHDKIAKSVYKKADVIIFCLSAGNLFTEEAMDEFGRLVKEKNVIDKIVICINKIDLETDENMVEYLGNLTDSVEEVLDELDVTVFDIYKISAKKYLDSLICEGEERKAKEDASYFSIFEAGLNRFAQDKKIMSHKCAVVANFVSVFIQNIIDKENEKHTIFESGREEQKIYVNNSKRKIQKKLSDYEYWCQDNVCEHKNKIMEIVDCKGTLDELNKCFRERKHRYLTAGQEKIESNFEEWISNDAFFTDAERQEILDVIYCEVNCSGDNINVSKRKNVNEKKSRKIFGNLSNVFTIGAKAVEIPEDKPAKKFLWWVIEKGEPAKLSKFQKGAKFVAENAKKIDLAACVLDLGTEISIDMYNAVTAKKEQKKRNEIKKICESQFWEITEILKEIQAEVYARVIGKLDGNEQFKSALAKQLIQIKHQVDCIVCKVMEE